MVEHQTINSPKVAPALPEVLFEDQHFVAVNKPAQWLVHKTNPSPHPILMEVLQPHWPHLKLHLLHRLDRETSGVLLLAKDSESAGEICKAWAKHEVAKSYLALVHGHVQADAVLVDAPIALEGLHLGNGVKIKRCVSPAGAMAQTEVSVLARFGDASAFSLVRCVPRTGRTHQIRVHLAHLGHPIVGDKIYQNPKHYLEFIETGLTPGLLAHLLLSRQALHAESLAFVWRAAPWSVRATWPQDLQDFCEAHGAPVLWQQPSTWP